MQLVDDVESYELMKLRLVNCSHQGLCYFARLCGYELVHDAAGDPLFQGLLRGYMDEEATPTLPPVRGIDLGHYKQTLIARLGNPEINDTIARLTMYGSDRLPKWLLPVVRYQLAAGGPVHHAAAIVASWARYMEGSDERGRPIEVIDRHRERLTSLAKQQREDPLAFISNRALFGDLIEDTRFVEPYVATLRSLHERGTRATLQQLTSNR